MYRCIANINKSALLNNLSYIKKVSGDAEIVVMVKANAYGHGLREVAQILQERREIYLGVAALEEAKILRKFSAQNPILLFDGGACIDEAREVIELQVTPVLTSLAGARDLAAELQRQQVAKPHRVHLKIDTGFLRNGIYFKDLLAGGHDELLDFLKECPELEVEGIATHFPCADVLVDTFSHAQIERFRQCLRYLESKSVRFSKVHMANSAAILSGMSRMGLEGQYRVMVRPGLSAYGITPKPNEQAEMSLMPVMQIQAQIVAIKKLCAGEGVGYGHSFVANAETMVAIVAMGYGDGLRRCLSNVGHMIVKGIKVPIVGAISMDSCAIDIGEVLRVQGEDAVQVGHTATVLGRDGAEEISVKLLASQVGTVSWEILTSLAERLPRKVV